MQGIANGDPGAMDEIHIAGEALDVARFEIKRVFGNQDGGIRPALDLDTATNIVEEAMAGADVCNALRQPLGARCYSRANTSRRGDVHHGRWRVDMRYETRAFGPWIDADLSRAGSVLLDYNNEHLEADEAHYNVSTGHGLFHNVRGSVKIERRPNPAILISENLFISKRATSSASPAMCISSIAPGSPFAIPCIPNGSSTRPTRAFTSARLSRSSTPTFGFSASADWLPYATAPAGRRVRQTGFLIPDIGQSSRKGFILGEAFIWLPRPGWTPPLACNS